MFDANIGDKNQSYLTVKTGVPTFSAEILRAEVQHILEGSRAMASTSENVEHVYELNFVRLTNLS